MEINTGLIGYGLAGKVFHAPFIHSTPGLNLAKIRETKSDNIEDAQNKYPHVGIVDSADQIIDDPNIELVVIATPNIYHFELGKRALEAGKHVVIDKPFTNTLAEANQLIAISKNNGKILSVFHNRRWDSDFLTVKKIVESKVLGRIVEVEIHFDRYRRSVPEDAWREEDLAGSGIVYDLGVHLIDQAFELFGFPQELTAKISVQREGARVPDHFDIKLHYPELTVTTKAGALVRALGPKYILHGHQGSFIKYGDDVQERELKQGLTPGNHPGWGQEPESSWGRLYLGDGEEPIVETVENEKGNYGDYYSDIYNAIVENREPAVTGKDGANVIKAIELAMKSDGEKRTVEFRE